MSILEVISSLNSRYYKKQAEWVDEIVELDKFLKSRATNTKIPPLRNERTEIHLSERATTALALHPSLSPQAADAISVADAVHQVDQVASSAPSPTELEQSSDKSAPNPYTDGADAQAKLALIIPRIMLLVNVVC